MKFGKIIYWVAIISLAGFSILSFSVNWVYLGILSGAVAIAGVLNYFDIIANNPQWDVSNTRNRQARSRRAEYFRSLNEKEKEEYVEKIENELEKVKKLI
jgi:hypothetical protein